MMRIMIMKKNNAEEECFQQQSLKNNYSLVHNICDSVLRASFLGYG